MDDKRNNQGFALIALVIALAIAAIIFAMYYGGSGNGKSVQKTGQDAIEKTKENNATQIEQHLEIQNELNSIQ
jgi:Tfp pilus assembly protein PilE